MILSSTGKPFKNKSGAVNAIRIKKLFGYTPVEIHGGWACQVPENEKTFVGSAETINQIRMGTPHFLSDAEIADIEPDELEIAKPVLSNLSVKCPGCTQSFHETTDKYNPDTMANPSMLKLKQKYISWGWEDVPMDATAGFGCLECPECGYPLAPEGKLVVA